ncbi:MAG TPA: diaminopimelate decarboxylase [Syntrophales bacterium]|nr:diaminopimelate decarboxylase [Syntrophales bacterium]HOM07356.1 diaminopimelate decarboxylase [Syntrophales bacterium]HON98939.1 diaminopimelate decarboxylase [Syntrophales bacterium]HPQ07006.1 diaminopimelate decarboxylase [Syntrophales bacterium]HRS86423.1 diaminopimelate decarboxylase [Syntrophales bacterium]
MHHFNYVKGELYCEEVPVREVAEAVGTPFYLYSRRTLTHHFRVFDGAFASVPHLTCFAVKANSNIAILALFAAEGGGADIVSGGELFRALKAGVDPAKIVYSGVGKKVEEIDYALSEGILMFNIESFQELEVVNERAARLGKKAGIALRVNPDVDPETHPYISTGLKENKFGVDIDAAIEAYSRAARLKNLDIRGVSCHIGSQLTKLSPFLDALDRLKILLGRLEMEGIDIRYLDLGGGLGITYRDEEPPHPSRYAEAIVDAAQELPVTFVFEPGRVIVGNAGILVTKVLYTKQNEGKNFLIVDAGMNDLVRPSLYKAYHAIQPLTRRRRRTIVADVVGPICESGDYLAKEREVPDFQPGEMLAVMSAGAYGFTMASNYNSRPRVAEVMADGKEWFVIRRRETMNDLVRGEVVPRSLKKKKE